MNRRRYMSAVAALASVRWGRQGYDPAELEEWSDLGGGIYTTGEFTPATLIASASGVIGTWRCDDDDDLAERVVSVSYDSRHVSLSLDGETAGGDAEAGALAGFEPEAAKELGAALYQAAEELERRGDQ